jgi:FkbM family methyltransferase
MNLARKRLKRWIRRHGYEVRKVGVGELDDVTRLAHIANRRNLHLFLDVGANQGQFAIELRMAGFSGRIISFEPISEAHAMLARRAGKDPLWTAAPRMALGSRNATELINVSRNSYSSSLLPMTDTHISAAPSSAYVKSEEIIVRRLDDILVELGIPPDEPLALKIDTQGYEAQVLAGAPLTIPRIKLIFTELSLAPLYDGAPTFDQMHAWLRSSGFRCVGLSHELSDFESGEMLQVNGTFVQD